MGTDAAVKPVDDNSVKKKGDVAKENELSEEDKQLQSELDMLVERLEESNIELHKPSLDSLCTLIKSATTSMTSVPKPLKFLMPHYSKMKEIYGKMNSSPAKEICADIISVLGMTVNEQESRFDTLNYRLLGTNCEVGSWGHEYVHHLTSQIVAIWQEKDLGSEKGAGEERAQYMSLVHRIIPYLMAHNAEAEAIDLCIEIEQLSLLENYTTSLNVQRVCLYLISCVAYLPSPDNTQVLQCATTLYRKFNDLGNALRSALKLNDMNLVQEIFMAAAKCGQPVSGTTTSVQRQLAYLLGKQYVVIPEDENNDEDLTEMLCNTRLSEHFLTLSRELDITEPKVPEDIYKSHLEAVRPPLNRAVADSARINLAAFYVSGLVNCGFGKEKLLQQSSSLSDQKERGKMSAIGTLGWVLLWDIDTGLSQIDKYFYVPDEYMRAGGLLGCGVINCGVKNECDPALALLGPCVESDKDVLSRAAIIGLGVAYAGSMKNDAITALLPVILDMSSGKFELVCLASLSAGLITVGSLNVEVTSTIIQTMLQRPASDWSNVFTKFMALGLGLTCLGRQEEVEVILASLEAVAEPLKSMAHMICDFCAYACSGNVIKIQNLLHILSEKYEEKDKNKTGNAATTAAAAGKSKEKEKEKSKESRRAGRSRRSGADRNTNAETGAADPSSSGTNVDEAKNVGASEAEATPMDTDEEAFDFHAHQGLAVLGVAVIAIGEEVGLDMAFRMFGHLLRFGELPIKRAVPLALAMCYVSNPQLKVLDTLSKFSHDADAELSHNSILSMGLVGAGTNNARLAAMLRQLAMYYSRDTVNLFLVRLAQGLTHLGKGTLTLSPWHSDRSLSRSVGLAGLLIFMVACLDVCSTFLDRHDYLMFYLTPAFQPRLLMTFDEELKPLPVTVRVGQAVDVVGQAGRPKTITGFQTHTTPVLLSYGERAEMATEEYLPVTNLPLEGFVLLKKNPDYEESTA